MPIVIKEYEWKQSENVITIYVPMKNVVASKADIFTASSYIKISFDKLFFELFLLHTIEPKSSTCTVTCEQVVFELIKCESILWDNVQLNLTKREKNELKTKIIKEAHELYQKELEEKENQKHELKRVAVREQISLDTKQRELIEKIKNDEKEKELKDIEDLDRRCTITELSSSSDEEEEKIEEFPKPLISKKLAPLPKGRKLLTKSPQNENVSIPLPRKQSTLSVTFTQREFPTPSRESKLEEEDEWLEKQVRVRRSVGFVSEDLRPEERNPLFIKSKAEQFMKSKNYLAAVSAYTFGIKLSKDFPELYVERSEAHFLLEHYQKSTRDCSMALDLLKPAVASNFHLRIECIVRRGESLCKMGMYKEGIGEIQAALDMKPDDDEIRMKVERATVDFKNYLKKNQEKNAVNSSESKLENNTKNYEEGGEKFEAIFNENN